MFDARFVDRYERRFIGVMRSKSKCKRSSNGTSKRYSNKRHWVGLRRLCLPRLLLQLYPLRQLRVVLCRFNLDRSNLRRSVNGLAKCYNRLHFSSSNDRYNRHLLLALAFLDKRL